MAISVEVSVVVDGEAERGTAELLPVGGGRRVLGAEEARSDLTAGVIFSLAPRGGLRVRVLQQAPLRSGLGGSSAYGVALASAVAAHLGGGVEDKQIVALVRDIEARMLSTPTGEQDHWAAMRGGVQALHIDLGGNRLEEIEVDAEWMGDRTTVFFTGVEHRSGMVNWQVVRRRLDGNRGTRAAFDEITAAAKACREALVDADDHAVAAAIRDEWRARRHLAPEVSTPDLDGLVEAATAHGASAVKACGAGGGGSILVWHPPGSRDAIVDALRRRSRRGRVIASGFAREGCRISPES
jgi:D-glycero-alpha-D-manno-heptose-7-phosphate kinase